MSNQPLQYWLHWELPFKQKPEVIREISAGRTNRNFLIKANEHLYVLRVNASNSQTLGIDRQREKIILEQASAACLAPEVIYCSVEKGVLITEFIDGQHWRPSDLNDSAKLSLLLDGLNTIHSLPVTTPDFDYQQHAENYWSELEEKNTVVSDTLHRQRENIRDMTADIPVSNIICHQDPNPANIIEQSGKLYFLDWEYAAPAWPAFDFAALSVEWCIDADKLSLPPDIDKEEIEKAKKLYLYLCDLWLCLQNK